MATANALFFFSVLLSGALLLTSAQQVLNVNTSNSYNFLSSTPLLLEFYAPWCIHCKNFEPHYASVAEVLGTQYKFKVGACDSSTNPALAARFDVTSIPAIFLYRDAAIWRYDGVLLRDPIIEWATKTYKQKPRVSWLVSPIGPMGRSKGFLIRVGDAVVQLLPWLTNTLGLPQWAGFVIVALTLAFLILFATLGAIFVGVKMKYD